MLSQFVLVFLLLISCVDGTAYSTVGHKNILNKMEFKTISKGPKGTISYKEGSLNLVCFDRIFVNEALQPIDRIISAQELIVFECIFPPTPIVETLRNLNINASAIDKLSLSSTNTVPLQKGNYTAGLKLKTFQLEAPISEPRDYLMYNPEFLEPLSSLTTMMILGTALPVIPDNVHLETLKLEPRSSVKQWGNCQQLRDLKLKSLSSDNIIPIWPSNCSRLTHLKFEDMLIEPARRAISSFSTVSAIKSLHIQDCELTTLPNEILNLSKDLTYLNLTHNNLTDQALFNLPMLRNLTVLDLSYNSLIGFVLFEIVKQTPALRILVLDNNSIANMFCSVHTQLTAFASQLPSLERLSLNGMLINPDCFKFVNFTTLRYLDMNVYGTVKNLKLQWLPTTGANQLQVNMRHRFVNRIVFEKEDYDEVHSENLSSFWPHNQSNLTVLVEQIDCDCENYWFALALREKPNLVSMPETRCQKTGTPFLQEDLDVLDCNKGLYDDCVIRTAGTLGNSRGKKYKTSTVECHNIKTPHIDYPIYDEKYYKFIGLNISDNSIGRLNDFLLPETLQWVDLRGNLISRLTANETSVLFLNSNRRVWLSRNLFICDCESKDMIDALHQYRNQVVDFDAIMCIDSGKPLSSVTSYEVCQVGLRLLLGILGAIAVALLVIIGFLWRYRLQLRIYLYSRGWCLYCLSEEDEDPDRPYDVFLSFSHSDVDYVTQQLLPRLEGEPDLYRVCVHYRDWVVGDWIPAQIMRSVSLSKRTIIVLSRNFVTSLWGSLEFRYAVASMAKEGRSRLLVLVLDDVLSMELDAELQGYLSYNTYLCCDDPWFWKKLRYAMPHRKRFPAEHRFPETSPPEGHGVINPDIYEVIVMEPLAT